MNSLATIIGWVAIAFMPVVGFFQWFRSKSPTTAYLSSVFAAVVVALMVWRQMIDHSGWRWGLVAFWALITVAGIWMGGKRAEMREIDRRREELIRRYSR